MQKTVEIWNKKCIFSENPCAKMQKTQKSEKTITFYMKNCKKEQCCFVLLVFFEFLGLGKPLGEATGARVIHSTKAI